MPGPYDFTGQNIENTYQRVVQTPDGINYYDGTGSLLPLSSSFISGASAIGSTITFTRGDGSTFPVTVAAGTGAPGGPEQSLQFNSASVFSGSNNLKFDYTTNTLTLTGSLNITGSTTQIGNNNLFGNTQLSGSIIISGAAGTNNPTVRIYGDTTHNGYIRFDPVSTNIDPTISASYIYVSGSTNDLYFTQNGAGYGNTTRLRWLEGNLYTGLLHGGLITTQSSTVYQISSGSGIIVNLNTSIASDPYPTIEFLSWPNLSSSIASLSASFDQQFIAVSSSGGTVIIKAQGTPYNDGDYNSFIPIGIVLHQNRSTINGIQTFPNVAYGWKQRSFDFIKAFGPLKISGYTLSPSSSRGLLLAGGVSWVDGRNYTIDPNNPSYIVEATGITTSKIFRYRQSGSGWAYDTNAGAGYTVIDPTQYSNSGSLTPVSSNHWSIQRVFYFPNSATKALFVYYGNAEYANKTDAIAALLTEPFNEAPNTAANAILVGYMLLRNDADFTTAASYEFRPAGLFRGSGAGGAGGGGGGATTLAGLTDVSLSSLTYGDLLAYNASTGLWNNTHTLSGSYTLSGSLTTNDGVNVQSLTASFISASSITGSLFGTASRAITASYALNGGVTQILAGSNISLSPTNGLGQVTISSTGGGGVYGNTATGSYGSFYDTTTQTNPVINVNRSMSFNSTDISNGVSISGSTNPFNTYIKTENAGVYDIQFSTQLEKTIPGGTDSIYIWLRKNGIDLAETNTIVELSQNGKSVAAWNWFVNSATNDYYQIMWSSNSANVQLAAVSPSPSGPAVPSVIATVNRIDQFLSNTGSFTGSFTGQLIGTASWANSASVAISSSFALSSSFAQTASYVSTLRAAGLNTQIQFNSGSLLSGSQYFRYIYQSQSLEHGASVTASGQYSHAEGTDNIASGDYSHAEGRLNSANGFYSHAEGYGTVTNGAYSHTEGSFTSVNGDYSHAEGFNTSVPSNYSHAEGFNTIASGIASHVEGHSAITLGEYSHAEGYSTTSSGQFSHAEGTSIVVFPSPVVDINTISTVDFGFASYSVINSSMSSIVVSGDQSTVESWPYTLSFLQLDSVVVNFNYYSTIIIDSATYDFGLDETTFSISNAQNTYQNVSINSLTSVGSYSHAEGASNIALGIASHAEGYLTSASGDFSHTEGYNTISSGSYSHAEGNLTQTIGSYSHAEGANTIAYGDYSHAEGANTIAYGDYSHAEGANTISSGSYSHAEGDNTIAKGDYSHAEGSSTQAIGLYSHASGFGTVAYANRSFTAGELTIASGSGQVAIGILNTQNNTTDLFVIGNGYTDPFTLQLVRRDIFNVSTSSVIISGSVNISGSLNVNNGITGSLFGTASWASQAISSSFATLARSSSFINTLGTNTDAVFYPTFVDSNNSPAQFEQLYSDRNQYLTYNPSSGYLTSFIFSSSADPLAVGFVGTSSWAQNAINAQTASFLPVGTYQITSSWAVSASRAISSSFATSASIAQTASFVNTITTSSNALFPIVFVDNNNGSLTPEQLYTDGGGGLTYTPSTSVLKAGIFDGDLSGTADTASYVNGNIFTGANPALTASYALTTAGGGPGGDTTAIEAQFWFLL